jgi:hypothetical protein
VFVIVWAIFRRLLVDDQIVKKHAMTSGSVGVVMGTGSRHEIYVGLSKVVVVKLAVGGNNALHPDLCQLYFQGWFSRFQGRMLAMHGLIQTPQVLFAMIDHVSNKNTSTPMLSPKICNCLMAAGRCTSAASFVFYKIWGAG